METRKNMLDEMIKRDINEEMDSEGLCPDAATLPEPDLIKK